MKLMQIQADHQALLDLIEQTGGEITPENEAAIDAMIQEIQENVAEKTDNICVLLSHMKTRASIFKEREEIFEKTRKSIERGHERLRERLKEFGIQMGLLTCAEDVPGQKKKKPGNKIETTSGYVVSVQKAGGKRALIIDESAEIPEEFLDYLPPVVDKVKVRAALESGATLPFAKLEDQGINLIIK